MPILYGTQMPLGTPKILPFSVPGSSGYPLSVLIRTASSTQTRDTVFLVLLGGCAARCAKKLRAAQSLDTHSLRMQAVAAVRRRRWCGGRGGLQRRRPPDNSKFLDLSSSPQRLQDTSGWSLDRCLDYSTINLSIHFQELAGRRSAPPVAAAARLPHHRSLRGRGYCPGHASRLQLALPLVPSVMSGALPAALAGRWRHRADEALRRLAEGTARLSHAARQPLALSAR